MWNILQKFVVSSTRTQSNTRTTEKNENISRRQKIINNSHCHRSAVCLTRFSSFSFQVSYFLRVFSPLNFWVVVAVETKQTFGIHHVSHHFNISKPLARYTHIYSPYRADPCRNTKNNPCESIGQRERKRTWQRINRIERIYGSACVVVVVSISFAWNSGSLVLNNKNIEKQVITNSHKHYFSGVKNA